jgi:hypothetical protein
MKVNYISNIYLWLGIYKENWELYFNDNICVYGLPLFYYTRN